MKNKTTILAISVLLFAGILVINQPASAAVSPQTRLVSMQTDGTEVNYQPVQSAPAYTPPPLWLPFSEMALAIFWLAAGLATVLLAFWAGASFEVWRQRHKKRTIRMHSHSTLLHRHRYR